MTAEKEFIIKACKKIHALFPQATLEYEFKSLSETHFIKVNPPSIYDEDEFNDLYFEITDSFNEISTDSLCIITDENLSELNNAELICAPEKLESGIYRAYKDFFAVLGETVALQGSVSGSSFLSGSFEVNLEPEPVMVEQDKKNADEIYNALDTSSYAMAA